MVIWSLSGRDELFIHDPDAGIKHDKTDINIVQKSNAWSTWVFLQVAVLFIV